MIKLERPELIGGNEHTDQRGSLFFFNTLSLDPVKRFYVIEQNTTGIVRAWQGHQKEQKWFYVIDGAFKIVLIRPDHWDSPSDDLPYEEFMIHAKDVQVLHIPGGYASGFVAMEENSRLMVFSDFDLQESVNDDFRFNKDLWYKW